MNAWPFASRRRVALLAVRVAILETRFDAMDKAAAIMAAADETGTPREAVIAALRARGDRQRHLRVVRPLAA